MAHDLVSVSKSSGPKAKNKLYVKVCKYGSKSFYSN